MGTRWLPEVELFTRWRHDTARADARAVSGSLHTGAESPTARAARLEKELQEATEDVFLLRMELVECRSELVVLKRRAARWARCWAGLCACWAGGRRG